MSPRVCRNAATMRVIDGPRMQRECRAIKAKSRLANQTGGGAARWQRRDHEVRGRQATEPAVGIVPARAKGSATARAHAGRMDGARAGRLGTSNFGSAASVAPALPPNPSSVRPGPAKSWAPPLTPDYRPMFSDPLMRVSTRGADVQAHPTQAVGSLRNSGSSPLNARGGGEGAEARAELSAPRAETRESGLVRHHTFREPAPPAPLDATEQVDFDTNLVEVRFG